MLAKTRWSSSHTAVVPLGERFGVPSGHTVATKPRRCSTTTRFMSAVRSPVANPPVMPARSFVHQHILTFSHGHSLSVEHCNRFYLNQEARIREGRHAHPCG